MHYAMAFVAFTIFLPACNKPPVFQSYKQKERMPIEEFKRQVDPTLITKEFLFKKLGSIYISKKKIGVFVYESTFGKAERITRRLVFINDEGMFLGMYGNFSESPTSIIGNRIRFENDSAYKDELDLQIPEDKLPKEFWFRGEEFQLFGFK